MKPKTKIQKEVAGLFPTLPELTERQVEYAERHCFSPFAFTRAGGRRICPLCGHAWNATKEGKRCPECRTLLTLEGKNRRVARYKSYFLSVTTCGRYQVLRHFLFSAHYRAGMPAGYDHYEVAQTWISKTGQKAVVARLRRISFHYIDSWSKDSPLEIRTNNSAIMDNFLPDAIGIVRVLPELKRNGFRGGFHGMRPADLFTALLTDPCAETLCKAGKFKLLKYFIDSGISIKKYWKPIKICLRHGYEIADVSLWRDTIDFLTRLGKDTGNPAYVCPTNLKEAHDRYMHRIERIRRREEEEQRRRMIAESEAGYRLAKQPFLGMSFSDGEISLRVLESVAEFEREGAAMHHCVFKMDYHLKPESLIMSATVNGERVETVEVSLKTFKVMQSRGRFNKNTPYHARIIDLVNKNMNRIRRCARACVTDKTKRK